MTKGRSSQYSRVLIAVVITQLFLLHSDAIANSKSIIHSETFTFNKTEEPTPNVLPHILKKAEELPFLHSLLIVKDQKLITEKYWKGDKHWLFNLKSVSKSVLSAIVGIALAEGRLKSIDQKVMDFFPEYRDADLDPRIFNLTIRHLLMMRSGFDVTEHVNNRHVYRSRNWVKSILQIPFRGAPGQRFNYSTFNTHLLSAIISKATRISTLEYSRNVLFEPLGIAEVRWRKDPQGYHFGGSNMYITTHDMLRFGILYLNQGQWNGTRIVPSGWVMQSTIETSGLIGTGGSYKRRTIGYGHLWWIKRIEGLGDIPFAAGYGGQAIVVLPAKQAVIVTTSDHQIDRKTAKKQNKALRNFLFNCVAKNILKID